MSLHDLQIKNEYRSLIDNMVDDFYIPLLEQAISYKRAVGFFSSSSLSEMSKGISSFVKNGGHICLIASPYLSDEDIEAIRKGYELRDQIIKDALIRELKDATSNFELERLNLLANLISDGILDIKIALIENDNNYGMYHEKMGIIEDAQGNKVAFSGSMNESSTAMISNYEAIDVFCTWRSSADQARVNAKELAFSSIWDDSEPHIHTIEFPELKQEIIARYKKNVPNYGIDEQQFSSYYSSRKNMKPKRIGAIIPDSIKLYDYQIEGIDKWEQSNFRGIFDMATGTGKTYAGLGAVARLCDKTQDHLAIIIVCPYQHLVDQWVEDIRLFNLDPIIGYSSSPHKNYKKLIERAIFNYNLGVKRIICFICTNATFSSKVIQNEIQKLKGDVLLLVDEAHNFGAMNISKTLTEVFNYRLALSATLERHNDEEGTNLLYKYFGTKCIEYNLDRAIKERKLAPYYYYPTIVYLSDFELEKYTELTIELAKCIVVSKNGKTKLSERGKIIALKRSRIVAGAVQKISKLSELIRQYKNETHMLVYCGATKLIDYYKDDEKDDINEIRQIDAITQMLGNDLEMKIARFTSSEDREQRAMRKKMFYEGEIQALVAIKCLDEGVNIPKIKIAFILASTTNPKEYIQRRGRVLRLADGKKDAKIYDFITLPRPLNEVKKMSNLEMQRDKTLVKNELRRMIEFKDLSLNPFDSDKIIENIIDTYELYENIMDDDEIFILRGERNG